MLAKRTNGIPAYKRIQANIRTGIEAGELRAGHLVPSERELAKIHEVSLMTARHALASLEREGIVERRRGVGTFVAAPKIHFNKLMSYTEQMGSRGLTPTSKILLAKVIDDEEEATTKKKRRRRRSDDEEEATTKKKRRRDWPFRPGAALSSWSA